MSMIKLKKLNIDAHVISEDSYQLKQNTNYSITDLWINTQFITSIIPIKIYSNELTLEAAKISFQNQSYFVLGTAEQIEEMICSKQERLLKG